MASTQPNIPCMHCTAKDFRGVSTLGHRILTNGLYEFVLIYTTPVVTKVNFTAGLSALDLSIIEARGNKSAKPTRDANCVVVFNDLSLLLEYVKPICGHDSELITKTGFDPNVQPQNAPIPDQPVITKVERGKESGTYKAFLQRRANKVEAPQAPSTHQKSNTFAIEITLTPDIDDSWVIILAGVKSNNLIFSKYTPLVKNYIRIYGRNASGQGQPSMIYSFIPE